MPNRKNQNGNRKMRVPVETAAEVGNRLRNWAVSEMGYHPRGRYSTAQIPTAEDFKDVCCGPMVEAWKFVLNNVRSMQTVRKVKGNLEFHNQLSVPAYKVSYQDSSVFSAECAKLQADRHETGQRLTTQLTTTAQMETELEAQKQELQDAELKYRQLGSVVHDLQRRTALLKIHSCTIQEDLRQHTEYTHRLADHTRRVTLLAQQPVGESVYSKQEESHAGGDYLETECMKDVRQTCELVSHFLEELLQGSFSGTDKLMAKRKETLWQSVEEVLSKHSSRQILTSLCINAQDSVLRLRTKTSQIAIHQDIDMLKFTYESSGQLQDTSIRPNLVQSVHQLLEAGQEDHINRFLETQQCQNVAWYLMERISHAKVHLDAVFTKRYMGDAGALQMARHLLEVEMKTVDLRASLQCLDNVANDMKENIGQMMQAKEMLLTKYQKIQDFGKVTDTKQNTIRVLVKQNLAAQAKLEAHQTEVLSYLERTVCSDSQMTAKLSKQLHDNIINEVESFSANTGPLPIFSLIDSTYKLPISDLSINRFHGNQSSTKSEYLTRVLKGMNLPLYQAPECLLLRVMKQRNKVNKLRLTLTRCGQGDSGQEGSDGWSLLRHMKDMRHEVGEHDTKQQETVIPLLEKHVSRAPTTLSACLQLQDTMAMWWDQPAQHCAVNRTVDNMTLQQWTNRWTLAVTQLRQLQLQHGPLLTGHN